MAGSVFGDTTFEGSLSPLTPIVRPVEDNSAIVQAEGDALAADQMSKGFNEISRGIEASAPFFKAHFSAEAEDKKSGVLSSFQSDMLLIADAVDQGSLSVPAARMRMRSLNAQYTANNPTLLEDINNLQAKITTTAGLGDIVTTGNEEAQIAKKLSDEAALGGWGNDEQAVENMQNAKRSVENLASFKREIEYKQAMRQEITEADKFKATQTLQSFMTASFPWVEAQVSDAETLLAEGGDPGLVIEQLKTNINTEMAKIGFLKSVGGEQDVSYMLSGVEKMVVAFEDRALGKATAADTDARIKKIKAQNELVLRSDPELGPLISASELIGNTDPTLTYRIAAASANLFGKNARAAFGEDGAPITGAKPADIVGQEKDINGYLAPLKNAIENSVNNPTPELNQEVSTHITNLLRGVKAYSASTEDARDFRQVIEFFASPAVGKFAENNQAIIPAGVKTEAVQIIQAQYENVLLPLIRQTYEDATVKFLKDNPGADVGQIEAAGSMFGNASTDQAGTSKVIEPYWNGTGVEFRAVSGYENNAAVQASVKSLNTGNDSVANPLNTLIRAKAHMNGSTDYQKVYEETIMERLWGSGEEDGGATGASIDIDTLAGGNDEMSFPTEAEASTDRDAYYAAIKGQESGGDPNAKNQTSSATGLYQFIKGTWNQVINSPEGQAAGLTSDGRTDPAQQEKAIRIFTEWNASTLLNNGLKPTNGNLYAMHFLGDATNVLKADDSVLLDDILPAKTINANKFLKGKDVAWFRKWVNKVAT